VDGSDVVAIWDAFGRYLASARAGRGGPFLLECLTHRLRGHYEGDPDTYRAALAADEWQEKDPIQRLQRHGIMQGWFAEDAQQAVEREAAEAVEQAVRFARQSPFPPVDLIEDMVYADV
jgi:pyruvate dehydrogenase E1 component alpha subunit